MGLRKSICDLTLEDLENHSVWEFALDEEGEEGQDETTVRPYAYSEVLDPNDGMFIVRADFDLADGTKMTGYLTPPVQGASDLGTHQPVIVTSAGQVGFWCGSIPPTQSYILESYERLGGKSAPAVFPIAFRSRCTMTCGPVSGLIPGFLVLTNWQTGATESRT